MAFASPPKRKREEFQQIPQLQTKSIVPRFPLLPDASDELDGGNSPRTYVAHQFQSLALDRQQVPHLQLETQDREVKRIAVDAEMLSHSLEDAPQVSPPALAPQISGIPSQQQQYSNSQEANNPAQSQQQLASPPSSSDFSFELNNHNTTHLMPSYPKATPLERSQSPLPTDTDGVSDQYWHEDEITGHDPDDPMDDGYGINGIGFRPTAAIAWARSQKRKQQLAEYRSREAKEARDRRREKRRFGSDEAVHAMMPTGGTTATGTMTAASPAELEKGMKASRVRFEDG